MNGEALNKALNKAADKFPQTMRPNMSNDPIAIPAVSDEAREVFEKLADGNCLTGFARIASRNYFEAGWQAAQDAAHEADAQLAHAAAEGLAENHGGAEMRALEAEIRSRKSKPY